MPCFALCGPLFVRSVRCVPSHARSAHHCLWQYHARSAHHVLFGNTSLFRFEPRTFASCHAASRRHKSRAFVTCAVVLSLSEKEKATRSGCFFFFGKGGIRTLGWVLANTRFPVVRLRPAQPPFRKPCYSISRFLENCNTFFNKNFLKVRKLLMSRN